jgi:FtsP/CotA-like multicopper oxidase with cupredoxin domain
MKSHYMTNKIAMLLLSTLVWVPLNSQATISGITGPNFNFTAKPAHISTPDGNSILMWGYANGNGSMQYPGPTLIVNQGDTITITLTNTLSQPVSIIFPGQIGVTATGGITGLLTNEAAVDEPGVPAADKTVTYTFTASHAGTYLYHSGTRPELQIEMGLLGALIVRPTGFNASNPTAYNHTKTAYDREYLFLLTEIDPHIHELVEFNQLDNIDNTAYSPMYWMINGRAAPDILFAENYPLLPHQPYNCLPRMHPGDKLLMRVIGGGRDLHPFHHHGNHALIIAKDGRLLESTAGAGPDLATSVFTIPSVPGETVDAIFEWTGAGLGWDIYGHHEDDPLEPGEDPDDHGKPFPVLLPEGQNLAFGGFWSGSPFLGSTGSLPPGEGGLNENGGYFFMWHSHTEKELINFDIFPGGLLTMLIVEPHGVVIP